MLIISGFKKTGKKRVGYGKDYCNSCEQEAIVDKWRWFTWFHLFWIPLVPLGYRDNWICSLCSKDANARYSTDIFRKIFITLTLLGLMVFLFLPEMNHKVGNNWFVKGLSVAMFLSSLVWLVTHKKQPSKKALREKITPVGKGSCVYCRSPLSYSPKLACIGCKLEVYEEVD